MQGSSPVLSELLQLEDLDQAGSCSGSLSIPKHQHFASAAPTTEFDEFLEKLDPAVLDGLANEMAGFQGSCPEEAEAQLLRIVQQGQSVAHHGQHMYPEPHERDRPASQGHARKRLAAGQGAVPAQSLHTDHTSAALHAAGAQTPAAFEWPAPHLQQRLLRQQLQHQQPQHQQPQMQVAPSHSWDRHQGAGGADQATADDCSHRSLRLPEDADGSIVQALEAAADRTAHQQNTANANRFWLSPAARPLPDGLHGLHQVPIQQRDFMQPMQTAPRSLQDPFTSPDSSFVQLHSMLRQPVQDPMNRRMSASRTYDTPWDIAERKLYSSGQQPPHLPPSAARKVSADRMPFAEARYDPSSATERFPDHQASGHKPDAIEQWIQSRPGTQSQQGLFRPSPFDQHTAAQGQQLKRSRPHGQSPTQQHAGAVSRPGSMSLGPASNLMRGMEGGAGHSMEHGLNSLGSSSGSGTGMPPKHTQASPGSDLAPLPGQPLLTAGARLTRTHDYPPTAPASVPAQWQQSPVVSLDPVHSLQPAGANGRLDLGSHLGPRSHVGERPWSGRPAGLQRPVEEALEQYCARQRSIAALEGDSSMPAQQLAAAHQGSGGKPKLLQELRSLRHAGAAVEQGRRPAAATCLQTPAMLTARNLHEQLSMPPLIDNVVVGPWVWSWT